MLSNGFGFFVKVGDMVSCVKVGKFFMMIDVGVVLFVLMLVLLNVM